MIIRKCTSLAEAQFLCSVLEADGITATIPEEQTPVPVAGAIGGYSLVVPDGVADRAREILASAEKPAEAPSTRGGSAGAPQSPSAAKRAAFFKPMVLLDGLLLAIFLSHASTSQPDYPASVAEYLRALAASNELWTMGYYTYRIATGFALCGSVLMLFGIRAGLGVYVAGRACEIATFWVFPGGIVYGIWSVIGSLEMLVAGLIVGVALVAPVFEDRKPADGV